MYKHWLEDKAAILHKGYRQYFGVRPLRISQEDIAEWFSTEIGQRLLNQEQKSIDALLSEMFGYHLMSMSVLAEQPSLDASPTSHQFLVSPFSPIDLVTPSAGTLDAADVSTSQKCVKGIKRRTSIVRANFEDLPIEPQSIDVALLHHVLDFSSNPHQLLREVARALMPNGHIVLVGFNPWSLLGLRRVVSCVMSSSHFYRQHHLQVSRLNDWCKVLGLELVYNSKGAYGFPLDRHISPTIENITETLGKNIYPYFGGFYILVLRKNVTPMRMIKSPWKNRKVLPKWRKGMAASSTSQTGATRSPHDET
jgi:ubiquinone/menaquinone biosynthesis C-methylase UbiE